MQSLSGFCTISAFTARENNALGYAAAVHMDSVVMAFADGRAEAINAKELNSKFDIQKYVDDNFEVK